MNKIQTSLAALCAYAAILLPSSNTIAATVNWSEVYPANGTVTIPVGTTAIIDQNVDLDGLTIEGTLRCGNRDIELRARYISLIGTLQCGAFAKRHQANFTITLTGAGDRNIGGVGDKYLVAQPGSSLLLFGQRRTSWVRLTQSVAAGSTLLELEENDWRVGDQIVIAPTDFDQYQAEHATIIARSGNTVTLDRPLNYLHVCGTETYAEKSITECAEVGLLSRNITIRGDTSSELTQIGGHTMFRQESRIVVDGVEFWRMGQVGRIGRYPAHFHLFGDARKRNSSFRNNSIWRSYNRWVTLHGTQNLLLRNNVAYDGIGHGYYLEDGDEIGNLIIDNLGILTREGIPGKLVTPSDNQPSAFWIANPDNYLFRNVAAGAGFAGFWYSLPERPLGNSTADLWPRQTPIALFHKNTAHSVSFAGLMVDLGERRDRELEMVWYNPVQVPGDPASELVRPRFTGFTSYKSRNYGLWIRTFSGALFSNMAIADTWRTVYLANIRSRYGRKNVGTISNSLLVGETANVGQPRPGEPTGSGGRSLPKFWQPDAALGGVPFYDGPMQVYNTVFANFQGNEQRDAAALTNLFPNAFWAHPNNGIKNATFVNAQRVQLPVVKEFVDGDATAVFIDWDGSVTGTRGASVTAANALMDNQFCAPRPEWNAMQCDPSVGFTSVRIEREDGLPAQLNLVREDGRSFRFNGSIDGGGGAFFTLLSDMQHEVIWEGDPPTQFYMYVAGTTRMRNRGARLILPAPSGNWTFQVNGQYTPAPSLEALDSGPSNWYYDTATNKIHLRMVGDDNHRFTLR